MAAAASASSISRAAAWTARSQIAGLAAQLVQFPAQTAPVGAVFGLQLFQFGRAALGRIQLLEFQVKSDARFQDQGDPEQCPWRA